MIQLYVIIGLIITIIMLLALMVVLLAESLSERKTDKFELPDYDQFEDYGNTERTE